MLKIGRAIDLIVLMLIACTLLHPLLMCCTMLDMLEMMFSTTALLGIETRPIRTVSDDPGDIRRYVDPIAFSISLARFGFVRVTGYGWFFF